MMLTCKELNTERNNSTIQGITLQLFSAPLAVLSLQPPQKNSSFAHTHLITRHVEQKTSSSALGFKRIEQKVNVLIEFQTF